jgi:hypothetical protein
LLLNNLLLGSAENHSQRLRATTEEASKIVSGKPSNNSRGVTIPPSYMKKKIVIMIRNYRNSENCVKALASAVQHASEPSRVHVVIMEELHVGKEATCVHLFREIHPLQCESMIRSGKLKNIVRDLTSLNGPTISLHLLEAHTFQVADHRDFYLCVDSSVLFTGNWDFELIMDWYLIGNQKAILSTMPRSSKFLDVDNQDRQLICSARVHSPSVDSIIEINPPVLLKSTSIVEKPPLLQTAYSELFHFGQSEALQIVRSDPHTAEVWTGYEYFRATRFWTNGYDFYAPSKNLVYSDYVPRLSKYGGGVERTKRMNRSFRRMRRILHLTVSYDSENLPDEEYYRLGRYRSFTAWKSFSGIDPGADFNESTRNQFSRCNTLLRYIHYEVDV